MESVLFSNPGSIGCTTGAYLFGVLGAFCYGMAVSGEGHFVLGTILAVLSLLCIVGTCATEVYSRRRDRYVELAG